MQRPNQPMFFERCSSCGATRLFALSLSPLISPSCYTANLTIRPHLLRFATVGKNRSAKPQNASYWKRQIRRLSRPCVFVNQCRSRTVPSPSGTSLALGTPPDPSPPVRAQISPPQTAVPALIAAWWPLLLLRSPYRCLFRDLFSKYEHSMSLRGFHKIRLHVHYFQKGMGKIDAGWGYLHGTACRYGIPTQSCLATMTSGLARLRNSGDRFVNGCLTSISSSWRSSSQRKLNVRIPSRNVSLMIRLLALK